MCVCISLKKNFHEYIFKQHSIIIPTYKYPYVCIYIYKHICTRERTDKLFHPSPRGVAKTANIPLVVSATCKHRGVYM